jgi:hypothetical protein
MNIEIHLRAAGALQIALAIAHAFFPRHFNWKEELSRLSLLNRQIFLVHTAFICFVLLMMGTLSLLAPQTLLTRTSLSQLVLGGFAGFWGLRFLFQWLVYDWRLWVGNSLNTFMHWLFSALWLYLTAVYATALAFQIW